MKITSLFEIFKEAANEIAKNPDGSLQDPCDFEMMEDMKSYQAQEELYKKISPEVRAKEEETRKWFDKLDWYQYELFNAKVYKKLNSIITYLEILNYNPPEEKKEIQEMKKELVRKISEYDFGRELLTNCTTELFLQLFNKSKGIIIENKDGQIINRDLSKEEARETLMNNYADFKAVTEIEKELEKKVSPKLHLKDVAKSETHYKAIIRILKDEKVINENGENCFVFKSHERFRRTDLAFIMANMREYLKREISKEEQMLLTWKTFGVKFSKSTSYNAEALPNEKRKRYNRILSEKLKEIEATLRSNTFR